MRSSLQQLQLVLSERFPEASRRLPPSDVLPTGLAAVDARLPGGGLPKGCLVEMEGELSSGKGFVADHMIASLTLAGGWAGYVDLPGTLYPPSLAGAGACLERLLVVRPQALPQALWASELLVRCQGFELIVLDLTVMPPVVLAPAPLHRLSRVAEQGQTVVLLLTQPIAGAAERRTLPGGVTAMRLAVERTPAGPEVRLVRSRFYGTESPGMRLEA